MALRRLVLFIRLFLRLDFIAICTAIYKSVALFIGAAVSAPTRRDGRRRHRKGRLRARPVRRMCACVLCAVGVFCVRALCVYYACIMRVLCVYCVCIMCVCVCVSARVRVLCMPHVCVHACFSVLLRARARVCAHVFVRVCVWGRVRVSRPKPLNLRAFVCGLMGVPDGRARL